MVSFGGEVGRLRSNFRIMYRGTHRDDVTILLSTANCRPVQLCRKT